MWFAYTHWMSETGKTWRKKTQRKHIKCVILTWVFLSHFQTHKVIRSTSPLSCAKNKKQKTNKQKNIVLKSQLLSLSLLPEAQICPAFHMLMYKISTTPSSTPNHSFHGTLTYTQLPASLASVSLCPSNLTSRIVTSALFQSHVKPLH